MWIQILLFVVFWSFLYFVLTFVFKNKPKEWCNRIVTIIHALIVCRMVEYSMYMEKPFDRIGGPNTDIEELALVFSNSYFIFDSIWILTMSSLNSTDPLMLVHHFIGVFMLPLAFIYKSSAAEITLALWAGELTNPFLQYRYFVKYHDKQNTAIAFWNDFCFAVVFIFIRLGYLSVLCYYFVAAPDVPVIIKIFGIIFYIVGLAWSYKVVGFVKRKLSGKNKPA